jgi:hypothetical protein
MATKTLIEKIEALPPEKKAEVEHFVDELSRPAPAGVGDPGLVDRLRAQREELFRKHGLFDSVPVIRALREGR